MATKQYSKPQLIAVGDAVKTTLRVSPGYLRDWRFRKLFRI